MEPPGWLLESVDDPLVPVVPVVPLEDEPRRVRSCVPIPLPWRPVELPEEVPPL